ncbi:MAG: hypothetical protein O1I36_14755 [Cylindrospermopsis raciborskii PAMP2011]|nr:hypothetical protein [Cylindrospermopsis raciborskii PAMP2011]
MLTIYVAYNKMDKTNLYVISNGSTELYPENTLTSFTNKLPTTFDFGSDSYELGIQSIGFASRFKNVKLPDNHLAPSLIVSNCQVKERIGQCIDTELNKLYGCDVPVDFQIGETHDNCNTWEYFLDDREYTLNDVKKLCNKINADTGLVAEIDDNRMTISVSDEQMIRFKFFWVMMHKSFKDSFGFHSIHLASKLRKGYISPRLPEILRHLEFVNIDSKVHLERKARYKGEDYFVYLVSKRPHKSSVGEVSYLDTGLASEKFDLSQPFYPKYIRVICDNIVPQISDNTYSKDLLIFSPDYTLQEDYTFKEIECIDFIPLLNKSLSNIKIKLVDEENQQLQLYSGHATIIKLILKKMSQTKSFNIRLTSAPNAEFPDNKLSHFKVKLPAPVSLNKSWKVCVNTISHPSIFATFIDSKKGRSIIVTNNTTNDVRRLEFNKGEVYTEAMLSSQIDRWMQEYDMGTCELEGSLITFKFNFPALIVMPAAIAHILGYNGTIQKPFTTIDVTNTSLMIDNQYVLKFGFPMDLNYLKPNYIMLYSNIVKSTIIGSAFTKIMRIVPVPETKLQYVLSEFKHRDYYDLENYEISIIEVQLRAHDGKFINFCGDQDIILDLEFSEVI